MADNPPRLTFQVDDPHAADIVPLIDEFEGYLSEIYPEVERRPGDTLPPLHRPNVTFLTARVDGVPVACGAFADHGDYVEVAKMYVIPTVRGLGLGKQLLEALEGEIRRAGGTLVRLESGTAQTEAQELYEGAGYRRCGAYGNHRATPHSIFMEKVLA